MLFKRKTDWNLLARYVAGETDSNETESVLAWAEKSTANKALLKEIKIDWQMMDCMDERFDVDNAWNKLQERINGEQGKVVEMPVAARQKSLVHYFSTPARIAASIVLLAILGLAVVTATGKFQRISLASNYGEKNRVINLPDGSKVHLNSDTKISYSRKFGRNSRDISLTGEAYFEVTPDKKKPFRIYAGSACVTVVGTSFNVNTRKDNGKVEVYVESGIVELSENGNHENHVLLHPGNVGYFNNKMVSGFMAETANSIAWKTGDMTFIDTPLLDVIDLLNNVYNVNISVEGEGIDTIRINGSYRNDPLEDILAAISRHNPHLNIAKSDDTGYLSQ